jgi:branched-chain amino acid transport system substrate-binding protein
MRRRTFLKALAGTAAGAVLGRPALADNRNSSLKVGISIPMTGAGFSAVGRELRAAIDLYMKQNGDVVAGRKVELIVKDDAGVAENARRIIQEMIVNDNVDVCAIGITPTALAIAPVVTQAKKLTLVLSSGGAITTTKSPYFVRAGFLLSQSAWIVAEWSAKNGSRRAVTLVNDWAPGLESETVFKSRFAEAGGEVVETIRVPLANPDFAPFLQRISDLKPDTAFISIPTAQAPIFAKQFAERGLRQSGIKIIGTGDITDDESLNNMGDEMIGIVTAGPYSASHGSALNKRFVTEFEKDNSFRPDFVSLGAYDGMHLLYEALKKTDGNADGDALIAAVKGMSWESPRGPIAIDPNTRDVVQNIYLRKVERLNGQLWNTEFATYPAVKDPIKG